MLQILLKINIFSIRGGGGGGGGGGKLVTFPNFVSRPVTALDGDVSSGYSALLLIPS